MNQTITMAGAEKIFADVAKITRDADLGIYEATVGEKNLKSKTLSGLCRSIVLLLSDGKQS